MRGRVADFNAISVRFRERRPETACGESRAVAPGPTRWGTGVLTGECGTGLLTGVCGTGRMTGVCCTGRMTGACGTGLLTGVCFNGSPTRSGTC